ncbi:MAG: lysophospholipid acyltransferase family protein [Candidatus Neomarinimicrobiota bacterium]|nr:lysophospholipid acyltransferase family protein [Candidatus Neomarinimicrobiota bacterium]
MNINTVILSHSMKQSDIIMYFLLRGLKKYLSRLSPRHRKQLSQKIAGLIYHNLSIRQDLARENIQRVFPRRSKLWIESVLSSCIQFFTHNLIQFIAFPHTWSNACYDIIGRDVLDKAIKEKRGVIFLSAHFGPWEMMGAWLARNNYPITGVALRQKNRGANKFFQRQRELSGARHIFRKEPFQRMYEILENREILVLISDQDARRKGVFVDFLGIEASTPKGAAIFHQETNAPMVVGTCIQTGLQQYQIEFLSVKPEGSSIQDITQAYTSIFASYIHHYPEQYFWFHRRWKTLPHSQ